MKTRCIIVPIQQTNKGIETVTIQFSPHVFDFFYPKLSNIVKCKNPDDQNQLDDFFELKTPTNADEILKEIAIFASTQHNIQILIQWIYQSKEDQYLVFCNIGGSIDLLQINVVEKLEKEQTFLVKPLASKEDPKKVTHHFIKLKDNDKFFRLKEIEKEEIISIHSDILERRKKLFFKSIHEIIFNRHQAFTSGELTFDVPTTAAPEPSLVHKDFAKSDATLNKAIIIHTELSKHELLANKLAKVNAKLEYLNERIPNSSPAISPQPSVFSTTPESMQSELRIFWKYAANHKQILLGLINKITSAPEPDNQDTHNNLYALTKVYNECKVKYVTAINQREYQKKLFLWALYQTALKEFQVILNGKKSRPYRIKIFNEVFADIVVIDELGDLSQSQDKFYEQFANKSLEETVEFFKKHPYWKTFPKSLDSSLFFTYSLCDKFIDFYNTHPELKKSFLLKSNGEFTWETEIKKLETDMQDAIQSLQLQTQQTKTITHYNSQYFLALDSARKESGYSEAHKKPVRKQKIVPIQEADDGITTSHKSTKKSKTILVPVKIDKKIFSNLKSRFILYENLRKQKNQAADIIRKTGEIKDKIKKYQLGYLKATQINALLLKITNDEIREELNRKLLAAKPNFSTAETSIPTIEDACRKIIATKILGITSTNITELDHSIEINQTLIRINRQKVAVEEEYNKQNLSLSMYLENNKTLENKLGEITNEILQQLIVQSENLLLSAKTKAEKISESINKRKQAIQDLAIESASKKLKDILEDNDHQIHLACITENIEQIKAIKTTKNKDEHLDKYFARTQPIAIHIDNIAKAHDNIQRIYDNKTKTKMKLVKLHEQTLVDRPKNKIDPIINENIPSTPIKQSSRLWRHIGKITLGIAGAIFGAALGVGLGILAATCTYGIALPFLPLFIIGGILFGGAIGFLTGTYIDRRTQAKANQQKNAAQDNASQSSTNKKLTSRFAKAQALWKTQESDNSFESIHDYAKTNHLLTSENQHRFDRIHELMDGKTTSDIYQQSSWRETIQQDITFFNGCKAKYQEQLEQAPNAPVTTIVLA